MTVDYVDIVLRLRQAAKFNKDAAAARRGVDGVEKSVDKTDKTMTRTNKRGSLFGKMLSGLRKPASLAMIGLTGFVSVLGHNMISEWRESQKVTAQTNAVIASTGRAANVSADHIGNLANKLSLKAGIDDEAIQSGANLLLTFKQIRNEAGKGNDIFDQASTAILDMAVAMQGTDLKGETFGATMRKSSLQVGKALNDPIKGITALTRVGVTFSQSQKDMIKGLVESGNTMAAQKLILAELQSEFGGSAEAVADPWDKARVAFDNLAETLGGAIGPSVAVAMTAMGGFVNQMQDGTGTGGDFIDILVVIGAAAIDVFNALGGMGTLSAIWTTLKSVATDLYTAIVTTYDGVSDLVNGFQQGKTWAILLTGALAMLGGGILAYKLVVTAITVATRIWAGAQALLNVAMTMNPIGLIIAGVAALIIGFVIAYKKITWFRKGVDAVWSFVKKYWPLLIGILTGGLVPAIILIVRNFGKIKSAASKAFNALKSIFKGVVNFIIGAWNKIDFGIDIRVPKWVPGVGGKGFTINDLFPDIPMLASGGMVSGLGSWITGEQGAERNTLLPGGRVHVQPLETAAMTGAGGGVFEIHVHSILDGREIAHSVSRVAADETARRGR